MASEPALPAPLCAAGLFLSTPSLFREKVLLICVPQCVLAHSTVGRRPCGRCVLEVGLAWGALNYGVSLGPVCVRSGVLLWPCGPKGLQA